MAAIPRVKKEAGNNPLLDTNLLAKEVKAIALKVQTFIDSEAGKVAIREALQNSVDPGAKEPDERLIFTVIQSFFLLNFNQEADRSRNAMSLTVATVEFVERYNSCYLQDLPSNVHMDPYEFQRNVVNKFTVFK